MFAFASKKRRAHRRSPAHSPFKRANLALMWRSCDSCICLLNFFTFFCFIIHLRRCLGGGSVLLLQVIFCAQCPTFTSKQHTPAPPPTNYYLLYTRVTLFCAIIAPQTTYLSFCLALVPLLLPIDRCLLSVSIAFKCIALHCSLFGTSNDYMRAMA